MKCNIIKDLLPAYIDGLTSKETNKEIEKHLNECNTCRGIYEQMTADISINIPPTDHEIDFLKNLKSRTRQMYGLVALSTCSLLAMLGIIILLISGIGFQNSFMNYYDSFTLVFVLLPCLWILFYTKSFRAFGRALLFAVGKRGNSIAAYRESYHAVSMIIAISTVFGCLGFIIGMINCIRSAALSSIEGIGNVICSLSVAMLSLFYPLLLCVILLPVYFMLKKHIEK